MFFQAVRFAVFVGCFLLPWSVSAAQMTLLEAVDLTLENNDDLAAKQSVLDSEKELVWQARANVMPTIDYRYTVGKGEYSTEYFDGLDDRFDRSTLSIVQPVFSAQRFLDLGRSKNKIEASQFRFEVEKQTKLLELVEAYITLLKHEKVTLIVQQELDDHLIKMERLNSMLGRGLATKMDVLEAQSVFDELKANLIVVQNEALISKTRLSRLLSVSVDAVAPVNELFWQRSETILKNKQWHAFARENALTIDQARKEYDVAQDDVRVERAGHLPVVNFRAEMVNVDSYDTSIREDRKIQLELTVPIFQGGMTLSKTRAARSQMQSKFHNLQDSERLVNVKMDEVLTKMEGGLAKIKAYEQSVGSSNEYLNAAEKGLAYGLRGLFDVLEAKSRLYAAQRRLTVEVYDNVLHQFEFLFLIGMLNRSTVADYLQTAFNFNDLGAEPVAQ